jgi:VWFA-related protein
LRPGADSAAVLHFDRAIDVLQPFTSSREELTAALAQLKIPALGESDTRLYDAVRYAAESLAKRRDGRKAIILLSDGMDVRSQTTSLATAIECAQRAVTTVYAILMGDGPTLANRKRGKRSGDPNRGPAVMALLAHETGGGFFKVSPANSIEEIYAQIEGELRSRYSIAFTPDQIDASRKYRRLKLTTAHNGLTVQTRDGYYPR